jgi:ribonuclease E
MHEHEGEGEHEHDDAIEAGDVSAAHRSQPEFDFEEDAAPFVAPARADVAAAPAEAAADAVAGIPAPAAPEADEPVAPALSDIEHAVVPQVEGNAGVTTADESAGDTDLGMARAEPIQPAPVPMPAPVEARPAAFNESFATALEPSAPVGAVEPASGIAASAAAGADAAAATDAATTPESAGPVTAGLFDSLPEPASPAEAAAEALVHKAAAEGLDAEGTGDEARSA